ncbi:MAG: hypothetical protein C0180_06635 [Aciduliprofundum sp.]|nr:MAG: hypothetical protein C0180_06635 [Aciduliprofundum sp.]
MELQDSYKFLIQFFGNVAHRWVHVSEQAGLDHELAYRAQERVEEIHGKTGKVVEPRYDHTWMSVGKVFDQVRAVQGV